ncbi:MULTISPECIES: PAAR domain-containing protein [unclassified Pseudoalteromonas]|uniref:PAAR domain-containing protein n=1 Tax=unclassified Pseudoalteromonas TaxID=194690 RepID=UPI002096CD56|nr:PAAR domain-containing protein [Pseudoalteromonas sp. XMcav2-N]MCO7190239.1 PAAR domain-containing protein [Pseudoalteromonas sp. XMcav2-N]
MPDIALNKAQTNLHDDFNPATVAATQSTFKVNKEAVLCVGDTLSEHLHSKDSKIPPHVGQTVTKGAPGFTIGGNAVVRVGDPSSCNALIEGGYAKFIVGNKGVET